MTEPRHIRSRRMLYLGAGVLVVLAAAAVAVAALSLSGALEEKRLILARLRDASELKEGHRVYYRGVNIGKVTGLKPPDRDHRDWRVRMEVDRRAFNQIGIDASVRLDEGGADEPQVTILPGREPAEEFPGTVKVLDEVTETEEAIRMIQDVIQGLRDLSRSKVDESRLRELEYELDRLRLHDGSAPGPASPPQPSAGP